MKKKQTQRHALIRHRWRILFVAGFTSASILCIAKPYRPVQPLPGGIIDMHCHVAGIGSGESGCFVSPQLRNNWRFAIYLRSFGVTEKQLMEKGDELVPERISVLLSQSKYVEKAVILAMDGVISANGELDRDRTIFYVPNSFAAKAAAAHRNLLFGASINPARTNAIEQLEWAHKNGAVLIKWLPSIMDIDPADPRWIPFYRKLAEQDLPLLTHAGQERSFPQSKDELCDPERLRLPLSLGVKVIAAHTATPGNYHGEKSIERLIRLMKEYPNLYTDISSLTQINKLSGMRQALTTPEFEHRLVYGTDFPLINTLLCSPWYYPWRLSLKQMISISRIKNPWDQDVSIKHSLGTPTEVFQRFGTISKTVISGRDQNRTLGATPPSIPNPRFTYNVVAPSQ